MPEFDIAGLGLNATDTLLIVQKFPAYAGKEPFVEELLSPGGQVASAMVACAKLGLKTKYIGAVGDDLRGKVQMESLRETGIDLADVRIRKDCPNQSAYIIIDQTTGERTVLWRRPDCLKMEPDDISEAMITSARMLHIDGHDTAAVAKAASIAKKNGIPVTVDVDSVYHGFEKVLPNVDYLIASSEFPVQWTNERDPFRALTLIQEEYGMKVAAMTLGSYGALARQDNKFYYSPAFVVNCVDTTGAGDVFHGAMCYGILQGMSLPETMTFANAMAALNCTAIGARGGISGQAEAKALVARGERRINKDFAARSKS